MNRNIIGLIVAIVVIAGGWIMFKGAPAQAPTIDQTPVVTDTTTTTTTSTTTTSTTPSGVTVFYTAQGFSSKSVTVPLGTTVSFVNQGGGSMWVASAPHPTHQGYDGTTKDQHCVANYSGPAPFDQCSVGSVFTFTFNKEGTWKYHNHTNASQFGSVTVTAAN